MPDTSSNDITKNCDWDSELIWANQNKNYFISLNPYIGRDKEDLFPLTRTYLDNFYLNTDRGNLKATYSNYDCAADMVSFWTQAYGILDNSGKSTSIKLPNSGLFPWGWPVISVPDWFRNLFWLVIIIIAAFYLQRFRK